MMFGLPAAALAIYQTAKPENKKVVAGLMISAALTSFLTGITEPLEFSFLFVAPFLFVTPDKLSDPTNGYANVLGIPTLHNVGVFGGIIIGALAAWCYNKFYNITLPSYLGFFAGKRFVPIMMATTSFILAFPMAIIWPTIQNGLNAFSEGY